MAHAKSHKKTRTPAAQSTAIKAQPQGLIVAGVCVALVLACIAVYGQTLSHKFLTFDDNLYVVNNPEVQAGLNLKTIGWAFVTNKAGYFHPLTWMSHMLDCSLYGMQPWGHHLTNLLFHAASSALLFLALRLLTGALWPGAVAAALFAVHPLHVESVAWVAERKDVLSAFFWMLALLAYGLYARRGGVVRYVAVTAAFVLGLMSKPMVVTLPFALLLLDYWPLGRINRADSWGNMARKAAWLAMEKTPLFLITAASSVSTVVMQNQANNLAFGEKIPYAARCANAIVVYVIYLTKTVWPSGLAVFYPHPLTRPGWQVAGAALILAAITVFCARHVRRHPYLIVGWLWYLGTLVPVIELVQAGHFSHADRYTYIPSIGIFIMVAWGVADLAAVWRISRGTLAGTSATVLAALTILAGVQTSYWRDTKTLFTHAVAVGRESSMAFYNLGSFAMDQKRYDEAEICLKKSLALDPEDTGALNNLALIAMNRKQYDEAVACLEKVLMLDPKCLPALSNLGMCLTNQGKYDEARRNLQRALEIDPRHVNAMKNLAFLLVKMGRQEEGEAYARKAAELDPARTAKPVQ